MGNGDIGASINIYSHEVKITLAKSDVWDARYDGRSEETVLTHDDLIRRVREEGDLDRHKDYLEHSRYYNFGFKGDENHGPNPKRMGAIRVYHPGLSNTKVTTHIDILRGILETRFGFPKGVLVIRFFVQRGESRLWLTVEGTGELPWVALIVEKEPDEVDRSFPFPEIQDLGDHVGVLTQKIPEGFGVDAFQWSLAGAFPEKQEGIDAGYLELHAFRCREYCAIGESRRAVLCVGVATSRDGGPDTVQRAADLARSHSPEEYEKAMKSHVANWENFWARSGIALEDQELESVWYRNHFSYGCSLGYGVIPLGTGGNVTIADALPWRGDYHMNHNFQKWYVTALPTNHPEWINMYADFVQDRLETFQYQAQLIFGLEGAYCELVYFPYTPKENCNIHNYMGRALALTGWLAQPLWWYYEYMQDKEWLRQRAYPYIRLASHFYANYLDKYMDESGDIYPSTRIEEPGWFRGFKGSRNVISDLVMLKKCFEWAIQASEILDTDEKWRARWKAALLKVPSIVYGWENGEGYVVLDKDFFVQPEGCRADVARAVRWAGGGWPVFPGEYIDGDGTDDLTLVFRDMMRRTNLLNPFTMSNGHNNYPGTPIIHPISSMIPTIRLGVMEQFDSVRQVILAHRMTYGQASSYMLTGDNLPREIFSYSGYMWYDWGSVENKYLGVIGITEMLLQSQGGMIRLFPYYPKEAEAAFFGLRARGGFIVDAERKNGQMKVRIESMAGQPCRIRISDCRLEVTCNGKVIEVVRDGNDILFHTQKGEIYHVNCVLSE
jgi:hypothetical protein